MHPPRLQSVQPPPALSEEEEGATAIEYGLIASLVTLALITGLTLFAGSMTAMYATIRGAMAAAT